MPLNVGRYKQGSKITLPETQADEAGVPAVAGPAGATPRGECPCGLQETTKTVSANGKVAR